LAAQKGRAKPQFTLPGMIEGNGIRKKKPRWRCSRLPDQWPQRLTCLLPHRKEKMKIEDGPTVRESPITNHGPISP